MLTAEAAISAGRRGMALGAVVRVLLWTLALSAAVAGPIFRPQGEITVLMLGLGALWVYLGVRSARTAQISADVPQLVAAGDFAEAETRVERSLRAFSLVRPPKIAALHQLAVLRHAQDRYADAAKLCREVLSHGPQAAGPVARATGLILAQSLLELGDPRGAGEALSGVTAASRLSVQDSLRVTLLTLDLQSQLGAWREMMQGFMAKVQLAELMPAGAAAAAQAFLALAAENTGRRDVSQWLRRRVELLADVNDLMARRPALASVWPGVSGSGVASGAGPAGAPGSDASGTIPGTGT